MGKKSKLRSVVGVGGIILSLPLVIILSSQLGSRSYYIISAAVVVLAILGFFLAFENRKPQAKEIVVLAVMCAIAVAGRAAFIAIPFFKPVAAVVIITGAALGAQSGFLCGSISMLVSNFIFGQGSWTPWQMVAFGIIGFLSGIIFYNKPQRQKPIAMSIFGFFGLMLITGPILDMSSIFMAAQLPDFAGVMGIFLAGVPVNAVQGVSTIVFLLILAKPILLKIHRIRIKYGMMET